MDNLAKIKRPLGKDGNRRGSVTLFGSLGRAVKTGPLCFDVADPAYLEIVHTVSGRIRSISREIPAAPGMRGNSTTNMA